MEQQKFREPPSRILTLVPTKEALTLSAIEPNRACLGEMVEGQQGFEQCRERL
jgi:hypothetical protein